MKYYLTLLKRNPYEVIRKVCGLILEKSIPKSSSSKKVIIYSLGKAGTSSLYEVLRYLRNVDVRHVHYLSEMKEEINQWRVNEKKRANEVKKWLEKGDVLIISLIRDPFSRSISSVIQNYELYHMQSDFSDAIVKNAKTISLNWWDEEFLKSLKWDVFQHPFNKDIGYSEYQLKNNNKLLIIKSSQISLSGLSKLSSELNVKLKEKVVNKSKTKKVAIQNKHILDRYKFNKKDFDFISRSKFMNHFYNAEEIAQLEKRWVE